MKQSQFLISAPSSGSGKTMLTIGLLRAFKKRGLRVQPFKCGPDYIDIKFHQLAAGTPSINLDLYLSSVSHVKAIYNNHTSKCDVALVEGVMGLFDGYYKCKGSSAEIAEKLDLPIILVVTPKSMAYSVAPILYGLKEFNKNLRIKGVIFNKVNTESHFRFLKDACEDIDMPVLGYLPTSDELNVPSRYLGLNIDNEVLLDSFADKAASFVEEHIQVDKLLELTASDAEKMSQSLEQTRGGRRNIRSAVALDEAFSFFYYENIEYLKRMGSVSFFSPLRDEKLPDADFVYLPGGYPELHLEQLANNKSMIESVRRYIEQGGNLLAECGGMMYLSSTIKDKNGNQYAMVNMFNQQIDCQSTKLSLGYRSFNYNNLLLKGHEFHYSTISNDAESSIIQQFNARGIPVGTKLLRYKNALAGYTHIYWAELDDLMALFD